MCVVIVKNSKGNFKGNTYQGIAERERANDHDVKRKTYRVRKAGSVGK